MNRRKFITASGVGAAAAAATVLAKNPLSAEPGPQAQRPAARRQILMKIGGSASAYDEKALLNILRFGVKSIAARPQIADPNRLYATAEEFAKMRELPDKLGVTISLLTPPHLESSHIDREDHPNIMLGKSPERDREIEGFQTMIKNAAAAGIPAIKYNMSLLGVLRTGPVPGRGDTSYTSFDLELARKNPPNPPLTKAGVVKADAYWERITYFLERVVPVATEYKVRLACHPNDSMTPPEGYQGIDAVLSRPEGLKKFVTIKESPYHGLNLCLGTLSEMLMNPAEEIWEPLTWLAQRKKVHNIHFRNIKGNRLKFSEVAPDEGDVDFTRAVSVLAEHGYDGMVQPDHAVRSAGDTSGGQAYTAFVYGYIASCVKAAARA
jgi:mannonate dehydratase